MTHHNNNNNNNKTVYTVTTSSGVVEGQSVRVLDKTVHQFLNIPYAEPPVGALRFARPVSLKQPIKGIIDGTKPGNSCMQKFVKSLEFVKMGNITTSEDCLVLNVWTPHTRRKNVMFDRKQDRSLRPVMFWIYGGGLTIGSIFQSQYNASALAAHDIVVVSVNYRLGPFGYLYTGEDSAPGNVGFYDQILALEWVRDNIHSFGGDRNQITIFGESAGSWSASVHILSPLSKGLFKRVIMQSGGHMWNKLRAPYSKAQALSVAKQLATSIGCNDSKVEVWLQCLRGVGADKIINATDTTIQIYPLLDTDLLPVSAQVAFERHLFNKDLDILSGVNKNEGSALMQVLLKPNITKSDFIAFVQFMNAVYQDMNETVVSEQYLKGVDTNSPEALKWREYDLFGDIIMKCPTYLFAKQYARSSTIKSNRVYFYELTYQRRAYLDETVYGVTHYSDIDFVFGLPLIDPKHSDTDKDRQFSLQVMKLWTNFAKYGKPSDDWPKLIDPKNPTILPKIRELHPNILSHNFVNLFNDTCDDIVCGDKRLELVWNDEFNGNKIDTKKWDINSNWDPFDDKCDEISCKVSNNIYLMDGFLTLFAKYVANDYDYRLKRNYTTAQISSYKSWSYGRFELSAAMPTGPAITVSMLLMPSWLLPSVNIVDYEQIGQQIEFSVWYGIPELNQIFHTNVSSNIHDFHTYALDWTPHEFKWLIDGIPRHTISINKSFNDNNNKTDESFGRPLHLLFYIQVNQKSGNFSDDIYRQWNCSALIVDYVRVYQWVDNNVNTRPNNTAPAVITNDVSTDSNSFVVI
ncbi:pyrethroid hydrolase Ces2a-like [Oppia nitens]|uniref:pyrethroid hydrolase Ces2a-like n=1 Tax=Oppia nitens TaxID=1686743 RepID=UPI0023D97DEC|nr:pyrethroid hydrolase Ces2a-like [Oppia nitens]